MIYKECSGCHSYTAAQSLCGCHNICAIVYVANTGVPIYRISKISAADMAKFSVSTIGTFQNCTDISTDILHKH